MIRKKETSKKQGTKRRRKLTHVVANRGALKPYLYRPKSKKSGLIEVRVILPHDNSKETPGEWVWARRISKNIYEVRNTPYLVFGLAWGDRVRIEERDGLPTVAQVTKRSGESTYRVFGRNGRSALKKVENALDFMSLWYGCRFDRIVGNSWAIGASSETSLGQFESMLRSFARKGLWSFKIGFRYGSKLNKIKSRFLWTPSER